MVGGNAFAKTICSICYEDLKPIVEDLQAISICGHVFHELCIQQWFEYCSNAKKKSCPVCKQTCLEANVGRLYFQSVGNSNDPSLTQKPLDLVESTEELRGVVKKLEGKVSGLSNSLERHQKDLKELNAELCCCKEQAKKEAALKADALTQKEYFQCLLHKTSEELDRSTSECRGLQERNMALAKELAALKLGFDINLEEEKVFKLASLGNEANSKDTVDVLKKSLVIRNKSYKELMAKCNILGRGEARSLKKLEKAKEKIKKLKTRVLELEMAVEVKDNEVLRALKASKKITCEGDTLDGINWNSTSSPVIKASSECELKKPVVPSNLAEIGIMTSDSRETGKLEPKDLELSNNKAESKNNSSSCRLIDVDAQEITSMDGLLRLDLKSQIIEDTAVMKHCLSMSREEALMRWPINKLADLGLSNCSKSDVNTPASKDEDAVLLSDDIMQVRNQLHIKKESHTAVPIIQPGDRCFTGGLLGPDGTKRHLGKWCKRVQDGGSTELSSTVQQPSINMGDLIAVGADGRGGRIKVLRSINQSLDAKEASPFAKRCKFGSKTNGLNSQGHLQIEHFFKRTGQ